MKKSSISISIFITLLVFSCSSNRSEKNNAMLFSKDNLVAWCIVPFDSMQRTPEQRATMLNDLGIKQLAYDWRLKHLPSFPDEVKALKEHDIKLTSVWFWIDSGNVIDDTNQKLLDMMRENNVKTDLWLGIASNYFAGLNDDQKLEKASSTIKEIDGIAKELGCTVSLYNHGDWFGEPVNQIKVIEHAGLKDVGIVYNFHHAHLQMDEYPDLVKKMLPYLKTVNLNGMKAGGPKILPLGQGDRELEMMKILKASGFNGSIGILGHVENEDIKIVLERNLKGMQKLLRDMDDQQALATYK